MLGVEEVVALATEEGLGEHARELARCVRPSWRLEPGGGGRSRVGGSPDLAAHETWPRNARGIPLAFAAQIDCRGLTDPCPWAHGGRLVRLFTDALDDWELGTAHALACDPDEPLMTTQAPPIPDPWPEGGEWDDLTPEDRARMYVLPETSVRLQPFLTAPETHPVLRPDFHGHDDTSDRYLEWTYRLRFDGGRTQDEEPAPWETCHVLGEATSVQDDVRGIGTMLRPELGDVDDWQVLLALHSNEHFGLQIFDSGAIHILAPVEDLAAGRLDRLVYEISSG